MRAGRITASASMPSTSNHLPTPRGACRWTLAAISLLLMLASHAQTQALATDPIAAAQAEADNRVIAARCGSPVFEKAFFRQSQAAVRAGLLSNRRRPEQNEKMITALRRNPYTLVSIQSDCAAQLERLKQVMKDRSRTVVVGNLRR